MGLNWSAGLEALGGGLINIAKPHIEAQIRGEDEQRRSDIAVSQAEKVAHLANQMEEEKRLRISDMVNSRAAEIAAGRQSIPDDVTAQAEAAAQAYSNAEAKGTVSPEDARLGMKAASDYANSNAVKGTPVTPEDRTQAAMEMGIINHKDAAMLGSKEQDREMRAAISQGRLESALQIAQMKGDFSMLIAAMRNDLAQSKMDGAAKLPNDAAMAEWMVENKVAKNAAEAYAEIKKGHSKDDMAIRAQLYGVLVKDVMTDAAKEKLWEKTGEMLDQGRGRTSAPKSGSSTKPIDLNQFDKKKK